MSAYQYSMAPVAVLCFAGTGMALALFLLVGIYGLFKKSPGALKTSGIGVSFIVTSYCVVLLGFSFSSRDVDLAVGAKKYFCEIDCHLAYEIASVSMEKAVGAESDQLMSKGEFVTVELRTWFDPSTISPQRGNGPLTPNSRKMIATDAEGHTFLPSARANEVLEARRLHSTPLSTPLRPGESYTSYLVFEVPARAPGLRLWLCSDDEVDALLWGNERSPLHGKVRFRLATGLRAEKSFL